MENFSDRFKTFGVSFVYFNLLAIATGITCGVIAIGFRYLIFGFNDLFFIKTESLFTAFSPYYICIIPAIGGLLVGFLTYYLASEAKGHGVPEVMAAMAIDGGKIRPRVVAVKALASSICIGSGGSAGREGPIVQMGSAAGSTIAQKLGFNPYYTKILVACGAAGGIAGTFNTPIAGVLFALELIIHEVKLRSLTPIVISSVFATIVSRVLLTLLGVETTYVFTVPSYYLETPWEIIFYSFLGIIAGAIALIYIKSLYGMEDFFNKIRVPEYVKPAVGGFCVGIMGLIMIFSTGQPYIFGVGYDVIEQLLYSKLAFYLVFLLIFLKIIATSTTLGSGGSGGVFAPSLFIGAMLGGAFGMVIHSFFPAITASFEAYALVGMAALFAGISGAILTSIIIIFEMTGNYTVILPLMFASVISSSIARFGMKDTIYTLKLRRRGIHIEPEMGINLMKMITVKDIMTINVDTVSAETSIVKLCEMIAVTGHMGYPVLDGDDKLIGIVTQSDLVKISNPGVNNSLVNDIMETKLIVAYPRDTLEDVLMRMRFRNISHFPVVDPKDKSKLIGFFTKGDIIRAYRQKWEQEFEPHWILET